MRFHRSFHIRPVSIVLVLVLSILGVVPLAHASTFLGYTSSNFTGSCGGNCADPGSNTDGVGQSFNSPLTGQLAAVSFFTGNDLPNKVVILTATFNGNPSTTSYGCAGGATCYFIPDNANQFAVQDVETLTGLSANTYTTVSLGGPVSVNTAQWVAVILMRTSGTLIAGMLDLCTTSCGSNAGSSAIEPGVMVNIGFHFGTSNPSGNYLTAGGSAGTADFIVGASFNPSSSGGQTVTVTQCYGNCGNPAITLANTNSTHTVNFNQTITLFYQFQSNVNGFLLNVTTSMAKSYAAIPNGPAFGVYTIQSCPLGQAPFSPQCPGLLQAQSPGQSTFSPPKGKISFSGLHIPVVNGQWVGIALSAFSSGLDVNDTNTNVNLWQTNEGKIPPSIQTPASLGNSKVGLWAWVNGNVVTGGPPTFPSGGACGPGLDLILSCVVTSSCSVVTLQCQTGASMFWVIILTIFTLAITLGLFSYWLPNLNLSTKGMGEFAVLIFIGWFAMFGAIGLLLPWLMILLFFVVAWLFMGRAKGTGPI